MIVPVDDLGEPVPVTGVPSRVVSLVPSLTESVNPDILIGATDFCTHPPTLRVTRVGGSKYPKVDRILALRPQLVLANSEENRPQDVARLRADGIPVWVTAAPATVLAALGSLRRLLGTMWHSEPDWLIEAERLWRKPEPIWASAIVPVWRKPWIVAGRDTFTGDVLYRLGVANVYAKSERRYPRPTHTELLASGAQLVVLPDEPYRFTPDDGPEAFPGMRAVLVSGRHLTWYGPSLVEARPALRAALAV